MPMRNMSKTDSGCGASCAATSPETIAAGVGRDGSYVVTDAPRATGRRSMGTIVQQPPGALPVVAAMFRCGCSVRPWAAARLISGRRVACLNRPGRCVCRWAAARPRDRHRRASGSEWSISRPALALPPPTGTAARPRRSRGGLQSGVRACPGPAAALRHRGLAPQAPRRPSCLWCLWRRWCFGRRRARPPARLGGLTSFGAAPRSPPVPSGPSGALHTGGACGSGVSVQAPRRAPGGASVACAQQFRT